MLEFDTALLDLKIALIKNNHCCVYTFGFAGRDIQFTKLLNSFTLVTNGHSQSL